MLVGAEGVRLGYMVGLGRCLRNVAVMWDVTKCLFQSKREMELITMAVELMTCHMKKMCEDCWSWAQRRRLVVGCRCGSRS